MNYYSLTSIILVCFSSLSFSQNLISINPELYQDKKLIIKENPILDKKQLPKDISQNQINKYVHTYRQNWKAAAELSVWNSNEVELASFSKKNLENDKIYLFIYTKRERCAKEYKSTKYAELLTYDKVNEVNRSILKLSINNLNENLKEDQIFILNILYDNMIQAGKAYGLTYKKNRVLRLKEQKNIDEWSFLKNLSKQKFIIQLNALHPDSLMLINENNKLTIKQKERLIKKNNKLILKDEKIKTAINSDWKLTETIFLYKNEFNNYRNLNTPNCFYLYYSPSNCDSRGNSLTNLTLYGNTMLLSTEHDKLLLDKVGSFKLTPSIISKLRSKIISRTINLKEKNY